MLLQILPVLRLANRSFEAKVSRLKDSQKTDRKVLARLDSEASYEAIEWAAKTKPEDDPEDDYSDVKLLGFIDWREVLERIRWRDASCYPDREGDNPPTETLASTTEQVDEHEAIPAESRVERGLPAEASDAPSAPVSPGPAFALYRLIRDHREPADRPVLTPDGPGQLVQVFSERAGVILDTAPKRITFFDPSEITSARPPGEASSPATTVDDGQEAHGC
jgi:hypothetical protein